MPVYYKFKYHFHDTTRASKNFVTDSPQRADNMPNAYSKKPHDPYAPLWISMSKLVNTAIAYQSFQNKS